MNRAVVVLLFVGAVLAAGAGGYWYARQQAAGSGGGDAHAGHDAAAAKPPANEGRRVLYWYDPMVPNQRFDKPGKSPFMDMDLVPRYADEGAESTSVRIDPSVAQNLGVRLAAVTRGTLSASIDAAGTVSFNDRDVAVVQARSAGFVERVYARAPGDVIERDAPLADLLVPEWSGAQLEFLALLRGGDAALADAARQRLRLLGMPADLVAQVERSGEVRSVVTVRSPIAGVIQALEVRAGMAVMAGQTLARVNGLSTVWVEAAVPEAQSAGLRPGSPVEVRLAAFPGEAIAGQVLAILPEAAMETRTLRVRVELPNRGGKLRPGMYAQVRIGSGSSAAVLTVPSEAVIRSGRRNLVMLAEEGGRYRPVEVEIGAERDGRAVVTKGLSEGQKVVASGQFLIDSEASLRGVTARTEGAGAADAPGGGTAGAAATPKPPLHEADAQVVGISGLEVTLRHGPFPTLNMGGMTMPFTVARAELLRGVKVGDAVRVGVRETSDGLVVEKLEKGGAAK